MKVAIGSEPDQSKDFAMMIAMTSFESRIMHSTVLRGHLMTRINGISTEIHNQSVNSFLNSVIDQTNYIGIRDSGELLILY